MGWRSGRSYWQDLRDRVLAAVDGRMPVREAAVLFKVSVAYIYKAPIRRRLTGDTGINPNRGRPPRKLPGAGTALAAHICSRPGITLAQAQACLLAEHGIGLSTGAPWDAVRRLGLSFEKALHAAEQERPDVAARRTLWRVSPAKSAASASAAVAPPRMALIMSRHRPAVSKSSAATASSICRCRVSIVTGIWPQRVRMASGRRRRR